MPTIESRSSDQPPSLLPYRFFSPSFLPSFFPHCTLWRSLQLQPPNPLFTIVHLHSLQKRDIDTGVQATLPDRVGARLYWLSALVEPQRSRHFEKNFQYLYL